MTRHPSRHEEDADAERERKDHKRDDAIDEEPTDGNMGPTGSGGVASQSPSRGHEPDV